MRIILQQIAEGNMMLCGFRVILLLTKDRLFNACYVRLVWKSDV